jgi:uncharacterized protein (DUF2062 family)
MRKHFHRYLPTPESILEKRWCAPFRPWLGHPSLWHLNQRSLPGAVAIGMICGMIPGPFQMLSALIVCIPLRKNIPLALGVTFYTNPFTIVPLYLVAYEYGRLLVGEGAVPRHLAPDAWNPTGIWDWMLDLGKPLGGRPDRAGGDACRRGLLRDQARLAHAGRQGLAAARA